MLDPLAALAGGVGNLLAGVVLTVVGGRVNAPGLRDKTYKQRSYFEQALDVAALAAPVGKPIAQGLGLASPFAGTRLQGVINKAVPQGLPAAIKEGAPVALKVLKAAAKERSPAAMKAAVERGIPNGLKAAAKEAAPLAKKVAVGKAATMALGFPIKQVVGWRAKKIREKKVS